MSDGSSAYNLWSCGGAAVLGVGLLGSGLEGLFPSRVFHRVAPSYLFLRFLDMSERVFRCCFAGGSFYRCIVWVDNAVTRAQPNTHTHTEHKGKRTKTWLHSASRPLTHVHASKCSRCNPCFGFVAQSQTRQDGRWFCRQQLTKSNGSFRECNCTPHSGPAPSPSIPLYYRPNYGLETRDLILSTPWTRDSKTHLRTRDSRFDSVNTLD
jgi:hypothetical protein